MARALLLGAASLILWGCPSSDSLVTPTSGGHLRPSTTGQANASAAGSIGTTGGSTLSSSTGGVSGATTASTSSTSGSGASATTSGASGTTSGGPTCDSVSADSNAIPVGGYCTGEDDPNCVCPGVCALLQGQFLCYATCTVASDCPQIYDSCESGLCLARGCGPGLQNGHLNGPCTVASGVGGTCVPLSTSSGVCVATGPYAGNGCDSSFSRWDGGCVVGEVCMVSPDGGAGCETLCDVTQDAGTCGENSCFPTADVFQSPDPNFGICLDAGWTCISPLQSQALFTGEACAGPMDDSCGCPLTCAADPGNPGGDTCLSPCLTTQDCPQIGTLCQGGLCVTSSCGIDGGESAFDNPCQVDTGIPGTCTPWTDQTGAPTGLCLDTGPDTEICGVGTRTTASCVAGDYCLDENIIEQFFLGLPTVGQCQQLCDPLVDGGACGANLYCVDPAAAGNLNPDFGLCYSESDCQVLEALSPCRAGGQCPCGLICANDPVVGGQDCQVPCASSSGCAPEGTACLGEGGGQTCAPVPCTQPDSPCDYSAPGAQDGTCGALISVPLGQAVGYACAKAGLSDGGCSGSGLFGDCAPGSECIQNGTFDDGGEYESVYQCTALCNPDTGVPGCGTTAECLSTGESGAPLFGFCCVSCL